MRIVAISDTHGHHKGLDLPDGDVLIHAGDCTYRTDNPKLLDFLSWFQAQTHKHKLFIAGNHDFALVDKKGSFAEHYPGGVVYLHNIGIKIDGINFYGTPYVPQFCNWAFMKSEGELEKVYSLIKKNTDILITHGPPHGILDSTRHGENVGSAALMQRILQLSSFSKLKYHIFGHIHEAYGACECWGINFINASLCGIPYTPVVNKPIVFDL